MITYQLADNPHLSGPDLWEYLKWTVDNIYHVLYRTSWVVKIFPLATKAGPGLTGVHFSQWSTQK